DGDLLRQITACDGGRHFRDVPHLAGKITRHRIHRISQVFPRAGHTAHVGLTAQFSFTADLSGDARYFRSEGTELVHHRVDGVFQLQDFPTDIDRDFLREIAVGHRGCDFGNVAHLVGQITGHRVYRIG